MPDRRHVMLEVRGQVHEVLRESDGQTWWRSSSSTWRTARSRSTCRSTTREPTRTGRDQPEAADQSRTNFCNGAPKPGL